jgi:hypothetical protein
MSACINRSELWHRNRHKRPSHQKRTERRAAERERLKKVAEEAAAKAAGATT